MTFDTSTESEIEEMVGSLGSTLPKWYKRGLFDKIETMWRNKIEAAVAVEREACAKVCDERVKSYKDSKDPWAQHHVDEATYIAICIRSRSHHETDNR